MNWVYMKGIPIEAQYLYRKALELSKREQYETALRYFRQAVVIAPRYSKALYEMANCQAYLGEPDEATRLYNRAREIDPALAEPRIRLDVVPGTRELNKSPQQFRDTSTV
jgi:tetratricopeptide (TPR) repeat protein